LNSVFKLSKICIRDMIKKRWGRIVNIASVVGITGNAGQANYSASKAGVIAFTKSLAKEVGSRNVTVNAIAPGFIETEMTKKLSEAQRDAILTTVPMQRPGLPEDIANSVLFLVSEGASYITGIVLNVSGGMVT
jgi:3-oxoacyl-[acyl-carrier protein] reductase